MYTYPTTPSSVSNEEIAEAIEKKRKQLEKENKIVNCCCSSVFACSFITCSITITSTGIVTMLSWPENKVASDFGKALLTIGFLAYFCGMFCIMRTCASCCNHNDSFLESYFCLFDWNKVVNEIKNCAESCYRPLKQLTHR